jgi:hypothetical protein
MHICTKWCYKNVIGKGVEDISQGKPTTDRIFRDATTSYAITHYTSRYNYTSASPRNLPDATDKIKDRNSIWIQENAGPLGIILGMY